MSESLKNVMQKQTKKDNISTIHIVPCRAVGECRREMNQTETNKR